MQYIMARCQKCRTFTAFPLSGWKKRANWYCTSRLCKQKRKRLEAKAKKLAQLKWRETNRTKLQRAKAKPKIKTCLHCGKQVVIPVSKSCMIHIYCDSPECQQARVNAQRIRNRVSVERVKMKNFPPKPKKAVYTDKPCRRCGKPVEIDYKWGRNAPIEPSYCKRCSKILTVRSAHMDNDWTYYSPDIDIKDIASYLKDISMGRVVDMEYGI